MAESKKRRLGLAILFVFYLFLCHQIPYEVDDWSWGVSVGIERLLSGELNSRYAGNLLECVITRVSWLKDLVMALSFTGIAALLQRLASAWDETRSADTFLFLLANLLLLTIPRDVWQQTYGWIAGFSNFVFSSLLLCLYLMILSRPERLRETPVFFKAAGLLLFGVVQQLFIENLTVFFLGVSAVCLAYDGVRRRSVSPGLLSLTLGNLLGAAAMFSNALFPALLREGSVLNGYRTLLVSLDDGPVAVVLALVRRFWEDFATKIWCHNTVLSSLAALLLIVLLLQKRKKAGWLLAGVNMLCMAYFIVNETRGPILLPEALPIHHLSGLMDPLFFLAVIVENVFLWRQETAWMWTVLLVFLASPAVLVPCTPFNTIGPRCYYTVVVLLALFCLLLFARLWRGLREGQRRCLTALCALALCAVCAWRGKVGYDNGVVKRSRDALIAAARVERPDRLTLPQYPHVEYLWLSSPESSDDFLYFRQFFKLPEEMELSFGPVSP